MRSGRRVQARTCLGHVQCMPSACGAHVQCLTDAQDPVGTWSESGVREQNVAVFPRLFYHDHVAS